MLHTDTELTSVALCVYADTALTIVAICVYGMRVWEKGRPCGVRELPRSDRACREDVARVRYGGVVLA